VKQAGSLVFKRRRTGGDAWRSQGDAVGCRTALAGRKGWNFPAADLVPSYGLAWGQQLLASLAEAMEHENLLDQAAFWVDVQQAVAPARRPSFYGRRSYRGPSEPQQEYIPDSVGITISRRLKLRSKEATAVPIAWLEFR